MGGLTELIWLSLEDNLLEHTIPTQLGNLTKLQELHLFHNGLMGQIPSHLGAIKSLTRMTLSANRKELDDMCCP
jgi:Leucine-rich repeat (LRR) protein